MENSIKHKASYLVSLFLMSKRHLKPIYGLTAFHHAALRYIADAIDLTYAKTNKFSVRLYQSQIAKYSGMCLRKAKEIIKELLKKRLLIYLDKKNSTISLGRVFAAIYKKIESAPHAPGIDRGIICTRLRRVHNMHSSNSSNLSNIAHASRSPVDNFVPYNQKRKAKSKKPLEPGQNESGYASVETQSTSYNPDLYRDIKHLPRPKDSRWDNIIKLVRSKTWKP